MGGANIVGYLGRRTLNVARNARLGFGLKIRKRAIGPRKNKQHEKGKRLKTII